MSYLVRSVTPVVPRTRIIGRQFGKVRSPLKTFDGVLRLSPATKGPTGPDLVKDYRAQVEKDPDKKAIFDNLTNLLLPPVADNPEKFEQVLKVSVRIANAPDRTAVGAIKNLLALSISNDIFEAAAEWVPIHYYETPPAPKGKRRKPQVRGTLYPAGLCDFYTLQNIKDPNRKIVVADTLFRHLMAGFRDFIKPKEDQITSEEKIQARKGKKEKQLDDMLKRPRETLEDVLKDPRGYKEIEKIDAIGMLEAEIRSLIEHLDSMAEATPELFDRRDHTGVIDDYSEHLISLESSRNFLNRFHDEFKAGKLPEQIARIYFKAINDYLSLEQWELAALFLYSAKKWRVMRRAIVGSVEDDLKLLASLPESHPLVLKYGMTDLTPISDLLNRKAITLVDASRILDVRPDILDMRAEINNEMAKTYGEDIEKIIEKLRPIFMTDKFLWHLDFRQGRSKERLEKVLYDKMLNDRDYAQIKRLLKRVTIGAGGLMDNFASGYSIEEFREALLELVVLGRRLKLLENLADEHGVTIRDVYNVAPDVLQKIPAADLFNVRVRDKDGNLVFYPIEHFKDHPANTTGHTLEDLIEMIEMANLPEKGNYKLYNFRALYLPRIKAYASVGLFHADDLRRLTKVFERISWSIKPGGTEEFVTMTQPIHKALEHSLIEYTDQSPELDRRFYTLDQYFLLEQLGLICRLLFERIENVGVLEAHKERLAHLKVVAEKGVIYVGGEDEKVFELNRARLKMESLKKPLLLSRDDLTYFSPEKVEEKFMKLEEGHTPLSIINQRDPSFRKKIEGILASKTNYKKKGVNVPEKVFIKLEQMLGAEDPKHVYLSDGVVGMINRLASMVK